MLHFFTDPYEEEILYSVISRYHYYSGNKDYKTTLQEILGDRNSIPTIALPTHLEYLEKELKNNKYTADYFIDNHSLLPVFLPFLSSEKLKKIRATMKVGKGHGMYSFLGSIASVIRAKNRLYNCPLCSEEDYKKYGEVFYRRIHQVDGVYVCPTHGIDLREGPTTTSRIGLNRLEYLASESKTYQVHSKDNKYYLLAKGLEVILMNPKLLEHNQLPRLYNQALEEKGYRTINGCIHQSELAYDFSNYYRETFLDYLNAKLIVKYHWLEKAIRHPETVADPVKHVLMIQFLAGGVEQFASISVVNGPFGKGPWPCLNPTCQHHKQKVISQCDITADYKTRQPVGTFKCDCGFVYSRKGPDSNEADMYRVGRVKNYGSVWETALNDLIKNSVTGVRELARAMQCDPKTVIKYASKLGVGSKLASNTQVNLSSGGFIKQKEDNLDVYKQQMLQYIMVHTEATRTEIRNALKKQYAYLYRHDRAWLFENLPEKKKRTKIINNRVDWAQRDEELCGLIAEKTVELLKRKPLVRVTKSKLGAELNISSLLDKKIELLPMTKQFINQAVESADVYRKRRIDSVISEAYKEGIRLKPWEVQRQAGIRSEYYDTLYDYIVSRIIGLEVEVDEWLQPTKLS